MGSGCSGGLSGGAGTAGRTAGAMGGTLGSAHELRRMSGDLLAAVNGFRV